MKGQFSRTQLDNPNVVLPNKLRPDASRDEIIQHYTEEGKLPRPFAPFMTGSGSDNKSDGNGNGSGGGHARTGSTSSFLSVARDSFLSMGSSSRRFSVASVMTTASSVGSGPVGKRKVRQIFNPVLPDELVISLGEQVTGASQSHQLPYSPIFFPVFSYRGVLRRLRLLPLAQLDP